VYLVHICFYYTRILIIDDSKTMTVEMVMHLPECPVLSHSSTLHSYLTGTGSRNQLDVQVATEATPYFSQ
jgi:hypothetical protein